MEEVRVAAERAEEVRVAGRAAEVRMEEVRVAGREEELRMKEVRVVAARRATMKAAANQLKSAWPFAGAPRLALLPGLVSPRR